MIQLYFPETNTRFNLNSEDAQRLLFDEIEKGTQYAVFSNHDFRPETLAEHNTRGCLTRYVIAFNKDYCIIGDKDLGSIWPYTHSKNRHTIGRDDWFSSQFKIPRP